MSSLRRKFVVILSKSINFTAWSLGCFMIGLLSMGYYRVMESEKTLKALDIKHEPFERQKMQNLISEAKRRFDLYNDQIKSRHLVNGMVVNRTLPDWKMRDECDSLLFSSLRYVALKKIGAERDALDAWNAIKKVIQRDNVMRHPQCSKPPSRDMILGFLTALSAKPLDGKLLLIKLMQIIEKNSGFFSSEKTHYSFLTPQIAQASRQVASIYNLSDSNLPLRVSAGFSTHELDSLLTDGGYKSHLIALSIWLELEILEKSFTHSKPVPSRSMIQTIENLSGDITDHQLEFERLQFVAQRLVEVDQNNLFFKWLRLKTANAMTLKSAQKLLFELLNMPQFPKGALPMDCDRSADYVWMRHTDESLTHSQACGRNYHGVDFLWMTSLLIEDLEKFSNVHTH